MNWFRSLKISQKLIVIILSVTISIVLLLGVVQLLWQSEKEKDALVNEISALARLIGNRSDAALAFDDANLANDNLAVLEVIPHISKACLYRFDRKLMADYVRRPEAVSPCPAFYGAVSQGSTFNQSGLYFTQTITRADETLGWISITTDWSTVEQNFREQVLFTALAIVLAAVIGVLMAQRLQRVISRPIETITAVADAIEEQGGQELRADVDTQDEIGRLARSFNEMLDALEQNREQLIAAKDEQLAAFSLYRNLIETTSAIPWEMNPGNWLFTFVGHQAEELFGYPISAWYQPDFLEQHIHPDDYNALQQMREAVVNQQNTDMDIRLLAANGRTVWLHMEIKVIWQHGRPARLQGFMLDISETREHEEAIKSIAAAVSSDTGEAFFNELVLRLSELFECDCALIGAVQPEDPEHVHTISLSINQQIAENMAYRLQGSPCETVIGQQARVYTDNVQQLFPEDELLRELNGRFYMGVPLSDSKGQSLGLIAILHHEPIADVPRLAEVMRIFASRAAAEMERLASDRRLRSKEFEQRMMLDSMVDGVITIDAAGVILSFNKAAEKMFGYTALEIVGQEVKRLMPAEYSDHHDAYMHSYLTTGQARIIGTGRDVQGLRKDGTTFPMRLSVAELPIGLDGKRRFIGSCLDISLMKSQEEMLRRSQKMDALGKLTGGVAHDFNNMLGIILGYSDLLSNLLKDTPKLAHYASEIRHAGERGAKLTKKLLSFSRGSAADATVTTLNQLLLDEQHMLEKTLTARIELVMDLEEEPWPVMIDSSDFEDAVLNMAINAMHAIPATGSIKLKTRNVQLDAGEARKYNLQPGRYVQFSIIDTGDGMDDETRERVFDPFYSTKGSQGTGLGLSQVYGFVQRSQGAIAVSSDPGLGSEFKLFFPVAADSGEAASTSDQPDDPDALTGSETILVVDDEVALLGLVTDILTGHGYRVLQASSAREAIEILQQEHVDLVLSDVIMPEMDGFELADHIRRKYPDIKIQLVSGFSDDRNISGGDVSLRDNMLRKPVTAATLLKRLRELLD